MPTSETTPKDAIIKRFQGIADRWVKADQRIKELTEEKKSCEMEAADCHSAARLFGFDILTELAIRNSNSHTEPPPLHSQPAALPKPKSIKTMVLEEAKKAFPNPVRASVLRKTLQEARGEELHEKTVGMTLYRLLKAGRLRRDNWDWYYIEQGELPM